MYDSGSLDLKLFHHDEAIHSWFSFQLLTKGTWVYDPSYHGPFLYFVTAGMFAVFGASDLVARLLPALFGVLLIPLVYCIYRIGYINRSQTLIVSLFLAISPDMAYFSRFLRHDIFMLFFTFLLVVALLYYFERGQTRFALIAAIATAGALCCKEEMPIFLIAFAIFFIYELWKGRFITPDPMEKGPGDRMSSGYCPHVHLVYRVWRTSGNNHRTKFPGWHSGNSF